VLDASALLVYLRDEPGAARVEGILSEGAAISAVNWAEVLSKLADLGEAPDAVAQKIYSEGWVGPALVIHPLTENLALEIARLRPRTRSAGLSIGDRACLALGLALGLPVFTTDRIWSRLRLPVRIHNVR
jgi:PIN domain nuclease of toxin-antitoxin system